jgi:beta-fructofuranosidase
LGQHPLGHASSADLVHWVEVHDFRDPYVFRCSGQWFMVVGASYCHERGQALLYKSTNGIDWDYRGPLFTASHLGLGVMWYCSSFSPVGDQWTFNQTLADWPVFFAKIGH